MSTITKTDIAAFALLLLCGAWMVAAKVNPAFTDSIAAPLHDGGATKIVAAYAVSESDSLPDPSLVTHIIYAFAVFNDNNDGVVIPNRAKFDKILAMRRDYPNLKVILSVGGYKKEGFSEMTSSAKKRKAFIRQIKQIVKQDSLAGISLDWEFPGTTAGGHTCRKDDAANYVTLVKDLRKALGKKAWLSVYSNNSADFIDIPAMMPYLSYMECSGYNLNLPEPYHQAALYPSAKLGQWCVSKSMERHVKRGVPRHKLLMGIPLFARGLKPFPTYVPSRMMPRFFEKAGGNDSITECWDSNAKAPYYADNKGNYVLGFDNEASIEEKCRYVTNKGYAGVFYWHSENDFPDHRLSEKIRECLKPEHRQK